MQLNRRDLCKPTGWHLRTAKQSPSFPHPLPIPSCPYLYEPSVVSLPLFSPFSFPFPSCAFPSPSSLFCLLDGSAPPFSFYSLLFSSCSLSNRPPNPTATKSPKAQKPVQSRDFGSCRLLRHRHGTAGNGPKIASPLFPRALHRRLLIGCSHCTS